MKHKQKNGIDVDTRLSKKVKHSNNRKGFGMKILNAYDESEYIRANVFSQKELDYVYLLDSQNEKYKK